MTERKREYEITVTYRVVRSESVVNDNDPDSPCFGAGDYREEESVLGSVDFRTLQPEEVEVTDSREVTCA